MTAKSQIPGNKVARRGGFSLAEVLIAMGIFGLGLAFTASLFPTGASYTKTSIDNVLGPMICENGLGVIRTRIKHPNSYYTDKLPALTLIYEANSIPGVDRRFPTDDSDTLFGFLVAGRQMRSGKNDYQFVIVAYRKSEPGAGVGMEQKSGTISDHQNTSRVVFTNADYLQPGTPVIIRGASVTDDIVGGEWATVVAIDDRTVTLDHQLPATSGDVSLYVIHDSGTNAYQSPAMSVLVTRMPLPE